MYTDADRLNNIRPYLFQPGHAPAGNGGGRPRKLRLDYDVEKFKPSQIIDLIEQMLALTISELQAIADDASKTALESIVAGALLKDHSRGDMFYVNVLLEKLYGGKDKRSLALDEKAGTRKVSAVVKVVHAPEHPVEEPDPVGAPATITAEVVE